MRISHYSYFSFFRQATKLIIILVALFLGLFAIIVRLASASSSDAIPEDAIRIRIIANSDKDSDQSVKNNVRDEVATFIESWGTMPSTHDEARDLIKKHLPRIKRIVNDSLKEAGVSYDGKVVLAKVPFPEKTFKGSDYSAGDYEALRITLGKGEGKNWWCVLFPPLCLTAATASDDKASGAADAKSLSSVGKTESGDSDAEEPKAKFFLWEVLQKLFAFIASLFS
jgi:stage II sporulation protein R